MGGEPPWVRLGDLVSNRDARRVPLSRTERQKRRGAFPYYGPTGVLDYIDGYLFEGLHLLIAEDGSVEQPDGTVFRQLATDKFWVNNHAHVVQAANNEDTTYLYYALSKVPIRPFISGSVQDKLTQSSLNRLPVPFPGIAVRTAVVALLSALDNKIDLNRQMAETLEATARALFKSWFVHFDPVRAKVDGRSTGLPDDLSSLFPERFSTDGSPEGWTTACLGDVVKELETGSRPKGGVSGYSTGVPSVGAESIVGIGKFDFAKTKYVPEEFYAGLSRGRIRDRDILLYKDGGKPGLFEPHVTLVGEGFPFERAAINEHVYRIEAFDDFGQDFLFLTLSSEACMEEMRARGTGVAIPGLNSTQIRQVSVQAATAPIRLAFGRIVGPLLTRILLLSSESLTLAKLRDMLLPKLISGELRIRDAEQSVAA